MRVPRAFSPSAFGFAAAGVLAAPLVAGVGEVVLSDRLGLATALATGLAVLAGALLAVGAGLAAAAAGRRIGFYEIAAAVLILLVLLFGPVLLSVPRLRASGLALTSWEAQGTLVVVLGLLLTGLLSGAATFIGASLGYLLFGSGRFDPSLGYELFIARSHLRLSPRTLLGLFLLVVTGIVPGLLFAMVWSFRRSQQERRAALSGEVGMAPAHAGHAPHDSHLHRRRRHRRVGAHGGPVGDERLRGRPQGQDPRHPQPRHADEVRQGRLPRVASGARAGAGRAGRDRRDPLRLQRGDGRGRPEPHRHGAGGDRPALGGRCIELPRTIEEGKLDWLLHPEQIPSSPEYRRAPESAFADPRVAAHRRRRRGQATNGEGEGGEHGRPPRRRALPGIAIGREMARSLRVFVGDTVNVISPLGDLGPSGPQPKSRPFRVAGIFFTGMYEYDSKFAYIDLAEAQRFFGLGESVHGFELKVRDVDEARPILRRVLATLEGYPYRVRDWGEINRNLFSALMMEKVVMAVILGFIVLVASFIIVATLIMQVLDKRREIAVLKSMGAGQPSVMKIFVDRGPHHRRDRHGLRPAPRSRDLPLHRQGRHPARSRRSITSRTCRCG